MSAHTAGPWTLETVATSCGVCHRIGPFPGHGESDKPRHACLYADWQSLDNPRDIELLANARLIAASPDLLDALMGAMFFVPLGTAARDRANAAIAKATGEVPA